MSPFDWIGLNGVNLMNISLIAYVVGFYGSIEGFKKVFGLTSGYVEARYYASLLLIEA